MVCYENLYHRCRCERLRKKQFDQRFAYRDLQSGYNYRCGQDSATCGSNLLEGGKKAVALIDECLEKEICFTQETPLSGRKTLDTIKRAIAKDYYIRLYYVGLDTMEESLLRIENRVKKAVTISTQTLWRIAFLNGLKIF